MKFLVATCQICGQNLNLQVEESDLIPDSFLTSATTCNTCYDKITAAHRWAKRTIPVPDPVKPEAKKARLPYADNDDSF